MRLIVESADCLDMPSFFLRNSKFPLLNCKIIVILYFLGFCSFVVPCGVCPKQCDLSWCSHDTINLKMKRLNKATNINWKEYGNHQLFFNSYHNISNDDNHEMSVSGLCNRSRHWRRLYVIHWVEFLAMIYVMKLCIISITSKNRDCARFVLDTVVQRESI